MTKKCCTCKQHKECAEFNRDRKRKDGFSWQCRVCTQKHRQTCWASEIVHHSRLHDQDAHRPVDSDDYIDSKWVEELVRNNPNCHYCGVPLKFGIGVDRKANPDGLQLDRMDSALEHIKSNCVQCCDTCNSRCQTMPYKWKKMSGGGNFAHFDMKWCSSYLHNGGDGGNHVRNFDEFGSTKGNKDDLNSYCKSCRRHRDKVYNEKQRALKKLKKS